MSYAYGQRDKTRVNNNNSDGHALGLKFFEQMSQYQVPFCETQREDWTVLKRNLTGYGFSEWNHVYAFNPIITKQCRSTVRYSIT
jgi:hypothetical protein